MPLLLLSLAWLIAVGALLTRAVRQNGALPRLEPRPAPAACPRVNVIVPARDEAGNIGACLSGLLSQTWGPDALRVIVVDDHSTDETARIVSSVANGEPRLHQLASPPLPPGWVGKCHACWIGACAAEPECEWLCFLDADVRAEPLLLATAIDEAARRDFDFLSLTPRQELGSFAERLVMPCGLYLLAFTQDLARIQAPDSPKATATGQFILVRRRAYFETGGHSSVRSEICEDVELAQLMKRRGWRVMLEGGDRLLSTRMYQGWTSLWLGITKNLVDMLGGAGPALWTAAAAVVLSWAAVILPILTAVGCARGHELACPALAASAIASGAAFGLHVAGAAFFGIPFWYGLLFPLGYSAGALMTIDSLRRRVAGRISWKGRTYP